jgi:hypothetical protein
VLYLTQRYFIGICALSFLVASTIIFLPIYNPEEFAELIDYRRFLPMLDIFLISASFLSALCILSVHPFITNGEETIRMSSPIEHPGLHGIIILTVVAGSIYYYISTLTEVSWQAERVRETCEYLFYISGASTAALLIGFYSIRAKSREALNIRRHNRKVYSKTE